MLERHGKLVLHGMLEQLGKLVLHGMLVLPGMLEQRGMLVLLGMLEQLGKLGLHDALRSRMRLMSRLGCRVQHSHGRLGRHEHNQLVVHGLPNAR